MKSSLQSNERRVGKESVCGGVRTYPGLSAEGVNAQYAPCHLGQPGLVSHCTSQDPKGPMCTPTEQFRVFPLASGGSGEAGKNFHLGASPRAQASVNERAIHDVAFCKRC